MVLLSLVVMVLMALPAFRGVSADFVSFYVDLRTIHRLQLPWRRFL